MKHWYNVHKTKTHACSDCKENFNDKIALELHERQVHGREAAAMTNTTTTKRHDDKSVVDRHSVDHLKMVNSLRCEECDYSAPDKIQIKRHLHRVHSGRRHICTLCDKGRFQLQAELKCFVLIF